MNPYPRDSDLEKIEKWEWNDPKGLIEYIRSLWWMPYWGFKLKGKKVLLLELSTGGWSGNEDIIRALQNTGFWMLYWEQSRRGGHYRFKVRPIKKEIGERRKR